MKKIIWASAIVCFVVAINSCKKDKVAENPTTAKYFTIENASFINENFPGASPSGAPEITNIFGNSTILEGGSNPLSITTSSDVKEILVGIKGKSGYYKVNIADAQNTSITYLIYLLFGQNFDLVDFDIIVAIVDNNGLISENQTVGVTKLTAGTGKLQVSCSWNKPNDIDLHLFEPNESEVSWRTDSSANGGILDVDSNPICYIDGINNENITYSGTAKVEKGKYVVRVSLFASCTVTETTNFVVTARLDGTLLTPTLGTNPFYGTVEASHSYTDENGDGERSGDIVMEFNVPTTKSQSIVKQKMLQFSFPRKVNALKKAMETR